MQDLRIAKLLAGSRDRVPQLREPITGGGEPERVGKAVPRFTLEGAAPRATDCLPGQLDELSFGEVAPRGADQGKPLRHQAGLEEVKDSGQQLAARQVAGRPEEHDHLVVRNG